MAQTAPLTEDLSSPIRQPGRWEWGLCWLMFASTVLNYMDRQAISLVSDDIKGEYHLSGEGFGWVLAAFYLTYAVFQVPAGYLADRWDVRWTYAGAVVWWSLAGIAAAFSPTLAVLLACRAMLGIGESFNWPCALRVTANILPPADRGLGNGIFNSGAAVGAILAPLTIPPLAHWFGWRAAFAAVGLLGFVWVVVWLVLQGGGREDERFAGRVGRRPLSGGEAPAASSGLSVRALAVFSGLAVAAALVSTSSWWLGPEAVWMGIALLMLGMLVAALTLPLEPAGGADWARSLGEIVRLRRFWVLAVVSISVNVCWHFLLNWMAPFLKEDHGFGKLIGGMIVALPFLAADAGNVGGGALSRFLARRGLESTQARFRVIAIGALMVSTGAWMGAVRSNILIIGLLMVMAMGAAAYMANYFALCQEVSNRNTGLVVGILGGLGNLFAAGFMVIVGKSKDVTHGFGFSFVVVALLPMVGVAALALGWGRPEPGSKPS